MTSWNFLIAKDDLTRTETRAGAAPGEGELAEGEALLAVEKFSLTANNVTYGAMGESFGYWRFFPGPEGFGRIPVWGFATVVASRAEGIEPGLRLFGYLPMSSHFTARLVRTPNGVVDAAEHRAQLPPTYNQYAVAQEPTPLDDHRALLRPLFGTSWLIDDFLESEGDFGAASVILTSASSKTALGLAWRLSRRGVKVVGLTSPGNRVFLEGLGIFDQVVSYDEVDRMEPPRPVVIVDFAGNRQLTARLHGRFGDDIAHSAIVGVTHWTSPAAEEAVLPGPAPTLFFAPDRIRVRMKDWGGAEFDRRFIANLREFVENSPWLKLETVHGPEGLAQAYQSVVTGAASPDVGLIVKL